MRSLLGPDQSSNVRHLAPMQGKMADEVDEGTENRAKPGLGVRGEHLLGGQSPDDTAKEGDGRIETGQGFRFRGELGFGEFPFAITDVTGAAQVSADEVIQIA